MMLRFILSNAKSASFRARSLARSQVRVVGCALSTVNRQNSRESRSGGGRQQVRATPRDDYDDDGEHDDDEYGYDDEGEDDEDAESGLYVPPELARSYEMSDRIGQQYEYLVQPELADDDPEDEGADDDEFIDPKLIKFPILRDHVKVEMYARHVTYPEYWTLRKLSEHYNTSYERTKAVIVLMHKRFTLMREQGFEVTISVPTIEDQAESLLDELNEYKDATVRMATEEELAAEEDEGEYGDEHEGHEDEDEEEDEEEEEDDDDFEDDEDEKDEDDLDLDKLEAQETTDDDEVDDHEIDSMKHSKQKGSSASSKFAKEIASIEAELEEFLAADSAEEPDEVKELMKLVNGFVQNLEGLTKQLRSDPVESSRAKLTTITTEWQALMDSLDTDSEEEMIKSVLAINSQFQELDNLSDSTKLVSHTEGLIQELKQFVTKLNEENHKKALETDDEKEEKFTPEEKKMLEDYARLPEYETPPVVKITAPTLWVDLKAIFDDLPEEGRTTAQVLEAYNKEIEEYNQEVTDESEKVAKCELSEAEVEKILETMEDHERRMANIDDHEEELQEFVHGFPRANESEGSIWPPRFEETPRYNSAKNGRPSLTSKYFPRLLNDQSFDPAIRYLLNRIETETKAEVEYSRQYYHNRYQDYQKSLTGTEGEEGLPKVDFHKPSRWKIAYKNLSVGKGAKRNSRESINIITRTGKFRKATPIEEVSFSWNKRPSGLDEEYTKSFPFARAKWIDPYVDPDREDYLTKQLLQEKLARRAKAKADKAEKK